MSGDTHVEVAQVTATMPLIPLLQAMSWRLPVMDHIMMPIVPVLALRKTLLPLLPGNCDSARSAEPYYHSMPRRLDKAGINMLSLLLYVFGLGECSPALRRPRWRLGLPRQPSAARPVVEHGGRADMDRRQRQDVRGVVEDTGRAGDFILKLAPWGVSAVVCGAPTRRLWGDTRLWVFGVSWRLVG